VVTVPNGRSVNCIGIRSDIKHILLKYIINITSVVYGNLQSIKELGTCTAYQSIHTLPIALINTVWCIL